MIWHQISALAKVKGLNEVILLGVYEDRVLEQFLRESRREFPGVQIKSVDSSFLGDGRDEGGARRGREGRFTKDQSSLVPTNRANIFVVVVVFLGL